MNKGKPVLSPDMSVCQQQESSLSDLIQGLPPELREMIYKEYQAIKKRQQEALCQRGSLGWVEVHGELLSGPFCEKKGRKTKVAMCRKCNNCEKKKIVHGMSGFRRKTLH